MAEEKTQEKLEKTKNTYLKYMEMKNQQPKAKEIDFVPNMAVLNKK